MEREGYERGGRAGTNPALLYGAGALVVAVVVVVLAVSGGGNGQTEPTGGGSGNAANVNPGSSTPETPVVKEDTLASLRSEIRKDRPKRPSEYKAYAKRFLALGGDEAKGEARDLYEELIEQQDPDDVEARKHLGYTDFESDILGRVLGPNEEPIPESIFNRRGYPFLDAVVEFGARRWLDDEEEIALAKQAVAEMREHARKLENDHQYRAADQIRANIAAMPLLAPYNYETRWAAPYLICYSSKERLSEYQLLQEPDRAKRKQMLRDLRENRKKWTRVLDEKELIYTQLYKEYMRLYGEKFGLKHLYDEYGGRPDYGSYKSYKDGVPLVIWIFSDREAFQKHHSEVKGENIAPFAAGYFSPKTSWVYLYDERETQSDRIFEIDKNIHEGTHQLEHWFTKQLNKWRQPRFSQSAMSEGIAEYLGSVEMAEDRKLKWTSINQIRLRNMHRFAEQLKGRNQEYPVFPVERLASFESYGAVMQWGAGQWGIPPQVVMAVFYQQSWAFVYFLNEFKNGKYKDKFEQYYNAVLMRDTGGGLSRQTFMRIFRFRDEEDWEEIEEEWTKFIREDLLQRDWQKYMYDPPDRDTWPGEDD